VPQQIVNGLEKNAPTIFKVSKSKIACAAKHAAHRERIVAVIDVDVSGIYTF
jgi:hypothetical protein